MEKQYLQFKVAEATKEKMTIVASDETLDRYGEVVPLDAWDFKNYKKNPVLLVDHDYKISNIVGRANNLKVDKGSFTFEPEFHNITQLAKEVQEMVEKGWAPAVSVGFLPHGPKKDGDKGLNELLEISFVAVGANPNALALAMKSIDDKQTAKIKEWVEKDAEGSEQEQDEENQGIEEVVDGKLKELTAELAELKEGRVLSGKNRDKIEKGLSALQQASAVLEDLLSATDSNAEKDGEKPKGRDPVEEQGGRAPKKANDPVVRVLQSINRLSNEQLKKLKE